MNRYVEPSLCIRIKRELRDGHRSVAWLADQTEIPLGTLLNRLACQSSFTIGELGRVAMALESLRSACDD